MPIDLHTHSRYSDGSDSPADIVAAAARAGLSAVALTDHDLLDGLPEAETATASLAIEIIPGTELSVEWNGKGMHLLTYWLAPGTPLAERLDDVRKGREGRNLEMVDALVDLGIDITIDELQAEAGVGVIGRPHFAAILVRKGAVDSIGEAFEQYLAAGRPAYRPRVRLEAGEAISLAVESGAVPVVAHPHTLADDADEFDQLFPEFDRLGALGIECHYVEYAPDQRKRLASRVDELGMVPTGGSDYHGTYKPGIEVGTGRGDLVVPDSCLERLQERHAAL